MPEPTPRALSLPARLVRAVRGNAISVLALVVASSGTALAATQLPDDSVDSDTVVYQSIASEDLAEDSVSSGKIRTDAVRGRAVKEETLDPTVLQRRIGGECKAGESIRAVGSDGSVLCQVDTTGATGAAGGDLTGSYPNPQIAAGAVGSAEIADASVTGTDIVSRTVAAINVALNSLTGAEIDESTLVAGGDLSGSLANAQVSESGLTVGGDLSGTVANAQLGADTVGPDELAPLPSGRAIATTPQTFTGAISRVQLDTEAHGQGITFDNASDQYVVQQSGIYLVTAEVLWRTNAAGLRFLGVYKDNSGLSNELVTDSRSGVDSFSTLQNASTVARLTAGQTVFVLAGTAPDVTTDVGSGGASGRGASLTLTYLGPAAGAARPSSSSGEPRGLPVK